MTIEATETETEIDVPAADWAIVDHPLVQPLLEGVSNTIGNQYSSVTTPADMWQEASIHLAQNAELVREHLSDPLLGERKVWRFLYSKLREGVRTDALHAAKNTSLSEDSGHKAG